MQLFKGVKWHGWVHVVFDVEVHVPVQKPQYRTHRNSTRIQAVIEHILGQTRVLGQAEHHQQPTSIEAWKTNKEQRFDTASGD